MISFTRVFKHRLKNGTKNGHNLCPEVLSLYPGNHIRLIDLASLFKGPPLLLSHSVDTSHPNTRRKEYSRKFDLEYEIERVSRIGYKASLSFFMPLHIGFLKRGGFFREGALELMLVGDKRAYTFKYIFKSVNDVNVHHNDIVRTTKYLHK